MAREARFEIYKASTGNQQWGFNFVAPNGEILYASERYAEKSGALRGIAAIKKYASLAPIREVEYDDRTGSRKRPRA